MMKTCEHLKTNLNKINKPFRVYLGTNEYIEYDKVEQLKRELEFIDLSKDQEDLFGKIFNYGEFGFINFYWCIMDWEE